MYAYVCVYVSTSLAPEWLHRCDSYSIFRSLSTTGPVPGEYEHPSSQNRDSTDGPQKHKMFDFLQNGSNNFD
jgi:hypothetical protein